MTTKNENLYDSYIRKLLCRGTRLRTEEIPQWLVNAKREQLEVSRLCKQLKREIKTKKNENSIGCNR